MKFCSRCVLPETYPGIHFDDNGVCNFCLVFKGEQHLEDQKQECRIKFEKLIGDVKGKYEYDCLLPYSGGKDSTYTLYLLKEEFKLRVLTVTLDNGFISEQALKNIRSVSETLGVDNLIFKPDFQILRKLFAAGVQKEMYSAKALERASTICNSCIAFVKFTSLKTALEKQIPIMAWGWSPGQAPLRSSVMKMTPGLFSSTQEMYRKPMHEIVGDEINHYFISEEQFKNSKAFPWNINPLAFMDYNEQKILNKIPEFGWVSPKSLDSNTTNCLLNSFANNVHVKRHNFHPYAFEIAGMVRAGSMTRDEGMKKLYTKTDDQETIDNVMAKLMLPIR